MLLKVINTELQFVFFDSVWATEVRPTCRVNEIKHLRGNVRKYVFALVSVLSIRFGVAYIFMKNIRLTIQTTHSPLMKLLRSVTEY